MDKRNQYNRWNVSMESSWSSFTAVFWNICVVFLPVLMRLIDECINKGFAVTCSLLTVWLCDWRSECFEHEIFVLFGLLGRGTQSRFLQDREALHRPGNQSDPPFHRSDRMNSPSTWTWTWLTLPYTQLVPLLLSHKWVSQACTHTFFSMKSNPWWQC